MDTTTGTEGLTVQYANTYNAGTFLAPANQAKLCPLVAAACGGVVGAETAKSWTLPLPLGSTLSSSACFCSKTRI